MTKPWRWFCLWFEAYARQSDTRCTYVCLHFLTFFYQWHVTVALQICVKAHVAVVFVDYSLSPEAKYPTAWEECFAVLVWLREHGREELKVDPDKIAVAGDSAGGRLTAALSSKPFIAAGVWFYGLILYTFCFPVMAKERQYGDAIKTQILIYPSTAGDREPFESYHLYGNGDYGLSKVHLAYFSKALHRDPSKVAGDELACPIVAAVEVCHQL